MFLVKNIKQFLNQGHKRSILAKKNILYLFIIKGFSMLVVFATLSISIKYLGKENYGIWIVISGLISWSNVFDLGFSKGLRNCLAEIKAKNNLDEGKYYVSTTYAFLFFLAFILVLVFTPLIFYIDWSELLNSDKIANESIRLVIFVVFGAFIIQFILKPITAIFEALQWPSIAQLITLLGAILSLFGIFVLLNINTENSLLNYSYLYSLGPVIAFFIISLIVYFGKFKNLRPSFSFVKFGYLKKIGRLGVTFFLIQLSVIVILQSDNLIITNLLGPETVTEYNIVYKYFSVIFTLFLVVISPFLSACTEAYIQKDMDWIKRSIKKLLKFTLILAILAIIMVLISDVIYKFWIDVNIEIPISLSIFMASYTIIFCFISIFAHFINGIGKLKIQLIGNVIAALVNIPLSIIFVKYTNLGVSGVVLATIISILIIGVFLIIQFKKIINNTANGIWNT
ncbi:lipopolysaccharide biosynthesis protein [Lacinutrix sp. MEBiC02404]